MLEGYCIVMAFPDGYVFGPCRLVGFSSLEQIEDNIRNLQAIHPQCKIELQNPS